jgi:hypothetical protein
LWNWKFSGYYNNADFYDLFGPTKVSRKGYSLKAGYSTYVIYDTPRTLELTWSVAGYGAMDRLPDYQNVVATSSSLLEGNLGLKYSFLDRSQGAVDDEKGTLAGAFTRLNYAGSRASPLVWAHYDRGKPAAIHSRTSISARSATITSTTAPSAGIASFTAFPDWN